MATAAAAAVAAAAGAAGKALGWLVEQWDAVFFPLEAGALFSF